MYNQEDVDLVDETLNTEEFVDKAIKRFVLQRNNSDYEINSIIYGVLEYFIWVTNREIIYILKKHCSRHSDATHFSGLTVLC